MSEFADYVHDQRNMGGFDLAPIQWVGGNGTYGYIIEVYLQAILLLRTKRNATAHICSLNPYDCLGRPSLFKFTIP